MKEKVAKVKMITVPGRKEPAPEMFGGRRADYFCPTCEPVPPEKKGHVPIGFHHDSCLLPKLAEEYQRLAIMEEVYNSPMQVQNRKLKKTEEALMEITRAIAGNTK